jgi:hypothetical protein
MKKTTSIFLILLFLIFQSCSKRNDNSSTTPTGNYSWSCKVNNVAYSWSGSSGATNVGGGACQYNPQTAAFSLLMSNSSSGIVISMLIPEYKKSTFILDGLFGQSKYAANLTFANPSQTYYTIAPNKVTLIVEEALNNKISGTFYGSLGAVVPGTTGSVSITEGKFTLQTY